MAGAKVKNPRKKFLWQIIFVKHPINPFLFQKVTVPEISIEQVAHGDVNYDVKTGGRVSVGNLTASKLETTSGSDTWLWDWLMSVQDMLLGGGLTQVSTRKPYLSMSRPRMEYLSLIPGLVPEYGLAR